MRAMRMGKRVVRRKERKPPDVCLAIVVDVVNVVSGVVGEVEVWTGGV